MIYTYKTPAGEPNYSLLSAEIQAALPAVASDLQGIGYDGTDVETSWGVELDAGQQTTLSSTITAHDPEPLANMQARLKKQSRDYFAGKLAEGALHDNNLFSESAQAQAQWVYLKGNSSALTYPYNLPTLGGVYYTVANETALLVVVDAVIADVQSKTEAFTIACNDITVATTKTAAQAAFDAYAV